MKKIFLIGILVLLMFPIQVYAEENTNINEEAENEKNQENEKDDNDQNYEIEVCDNGWIKKWFCILLILKVSKHRYIYSVFI